MDLQSLINQAESEIESRKSELAKTEKELRIREELLSKKENELAIRESEISKKVVVADKLNRESKEVEKKLLNEKELNERLMFVEKREKEAKKILEDAETVKMETERQYKEARELKAKIDKEAIEFKGKLISNLQEMINKA